MKAVRLNAEKEPELVDIAEPEPAPNEVLIRPHYCGICGSDLHTKDNALFVPGVVMGHEFAGEIVGTGSAVHNWSVGQRVTINPNGRVCGVCAACRAGRYNLCRVGTWENPAGVAKNGGMAEFVALHEAYLHAIPDALDTKRAAWTEPLAVALRTVRTSPVRIGDRVAVIGGGPVGQLIQQLLRRIGARQVVMIEPSAYRRSVAEALGADETLTPGEARERVDAGEVELYAHVFESSGHRDSLQLAIDLVAPGGSVRLVGMSPVPIPIDPVSTITKEVQILTGFIYNDEFERSIPLLADGAVDVDALTTDVLPLDRYAEGFAALRAPDSSMKVLIGQGASAPH